MFIATSLLFSNKQQLIIFIVTNYISRRSSASNCVQLNLQPSFAPACRASISPIPILRSSPCSGFTCPIVPSFSCAPCSPCGPYIPCIIKYYPYAASRITCMPTCPPCTVTTYRC